MCIRDSSGGEERGTNSYVGSGKITIESDKPDQYTLEELAKTQLLEIRNINLGDLKYELSDEKHTEVYNESAFVPSVDYDYGLLLDPTQTPVTTLTTTTITSDETAPTGVIRVGLNEVVSIGATYTVPNPAFSALLNTFVIMVLLFNFKRGFPGNLWAAILEGIMIIVLDISL